LTGQTERRTPCAMPSSDKDAEPAPPRREQALAQALRANLKRRKAGGAPTSEKAAPVKSGDAD
jgi:hypothetical protein